MILGALVVAHHGRNLLFDDRNPLELALMVGHLVFDIVLPLHVLLQFLLRGRDLRL